MLHFKRAHFALGVAKHEYWSKFLARASSVKMLRWQTWLLPRDKSREFASIFEAGSKLGREHKFWIQFRPQKSKRGDERNETKR